MRSFIRASGCTGLFALTVLTGCEADRPDSSLVRSGAVLAPPVSVALSRLMLWRMLGASHPMEAHMVDSRAIAARGASADASEGVVSFLEKRPAVFPVRVSDGLPEVFPGWSPPEFS